MSCTSSKTSASWSFLRLLSFFFEKDESPFTTFSALNHSVCCTDGEMGIFFLSDLGLTHLPFLYWRKDGVMDSNMCRFKGIRKVRKSRRKDTNMWIACIMCHSCIGLEVVDITRHRERQRANLSASVIWEWSETKTMSTMWNKRIRSSCKRKACESHKCHKGNKWT